MGPILLLTLRALTRSRRLLAVALLLVIPALLALLFLGSRATENGGQFAFEVFYFLVVPILIPLTTLILATSALGGEVEEGTIIYLTLKPVSRPTIVVAKLLAALLVSLVLVEISSILTYVIATGGNIVLQDLGAIVGAALAGCIAYTAVFLPLGLFLPKRGLIVGFFYVLFWEGTLSALSTGLATLSVRRYVQGVLEAGLGSSPLASLHPSPVSGTVSVLVVLGLLVAGSLVATWRLIRIQLP
jgi:ABC-2 type transport system permease protein